MLHFYSYIHKTCTLLYWSEPCNTLFSFSYVYICLVSESIDGSHYLQNWLNHLFICLKRRQIAICFLFVFLLISHRAAHCTVELMFIQPWHVRSYRTALSHFDIVTRSKTALMSLGNILSSRFLTKFVDESLKCMYTYGILHTINCTIMRFRIET